MKHSLIISRAFVLAIVAALNIGTTFADDEPNSRELKSIAFIQQTSLDIRPPDGRFPENQAEQILAEELERDPVVAAERFWPQMNYMWKAAAVSHRPLYFQDANLERYGHHHGIFEPAVSAAKFFGRIPVIPYMVGTTPCDECQYSLGYYRPGDCVPLHKTHAKHSVRGAVYEAAAITGGVFLIP